MRLELVGDSNCKLAGGPPRIILTPNPIPALAQGEDELEISFPVDGCVIWQVEVLFSPRGLSNKMTAWSNEVQCF